MSENNCPTCVIWVNSVVENNCDKCVNNSEYDPFVKPIKEVCEIKQLTIEELREQFESIYIHKALNKNSEGVYTYADIQFKWMGFQECAKANNLLKDGE